MGLFRNVVLLLVLFLLGGVVTFALMSVWNQGAARTETVSSQVVVQEIRQIGRLELVHYRLQDVLEYRVNQPTLIPFLGAIPKSGKVLLVISGEVIGCVDLARLDSNAISIQDSVATIRLPAAQLCVVRVDHSQTRVYDASFTPFRFSDTERTQFLNNAYQAAERNLQAAAVKQGILAQTDAQARAFLTPLLRRLGIKQVVWASAP